MKAVVMAGGEGSRLRPLTINRPKPLIPVCNKPVMEHILTLLKRHGVHEIVATLHYLGEEIQGYFGDGAEFDTEITYSIEDTPLGTAGSVKKAESLLKDETFLIVSGDALTDCDLTRAIAFHKEKKALATLILCRVESPLEFGVVVTNEDGRVVRFLEKPDWSEVLTDSVNTGIYILEPEVFEYVPEGKPSDWSQDVFPELVKADEPVYGFIMDGYWTDIGSLNQCRDTQEDMLRGQVQLAIPGEEAVEGVHIESGALIDQTASIIPPVLIGRNCKVKAGATIGPYTVLGDNCYVETSAVVERSMVWENSYIGAEATVRSAVVGSRVTIKRGCDIGEEAVIGDRCLLDVGAVVRPRIKIWPDKQIERGSIVTMSLVWGSKWRGSLFRELGVAGLSNIEITPEFATRLASAYGSCLPPRSKVVTGRDSTRSSRMIKRAVIAALLSVGCDVLDLRSTAAPVVRHFIRASGAAGAINVRKLPGNSRVTLLEMFDSRGAYLSRALERKVETAFYREDFNRTDPDDLGVIEFGNRAIEEYQEDFFRNLQPVSGGRRLRIACDYGFSALAASYPSMLAKFGVDSISLNGYNDAKLAPRSPDQIARHMENLCEIVRTLGYDMGALFTDEGERLSVVDNEGKTLSGTDLLAVICQMLSRTQPGATVGMTVTAPLKLETALKAAGLGVIRTKADTPDITATALDAGLNFAGDDRGGFIFPEFSSGFDAAFSLAKLIVMLQETGQSLTDVMRTVPKFDLAYEKVPCPWEAKGSVMRRIGEEQHDPAQVDLVDGIKIFRDSGWVLVLPDAVEPVFHVYAEADGEAESKKLVRAYIDKIEGIVAKH